MLRPWHGLQEDDPEIFSVIEAELQRQQDGLELIASENFASAPVIAAMGNIMTNKYAEGLPHKRYYGGCEHVDRVEELAIERVTTLFRAKFANVQPHSGAQANAAVYLALAKPGDHLLGLDLSHGGHLTHGSKVNFSGLIYQSHFYSLDQTDRINYDQVRDLALKLRPRILIAGASAYPRQIDLQAFRAIADEVGAYLVVDMAHIAGLVAADEHPSPLPYAHAVTSTTHKTLRGPRGGHILWNDAELSAAINKAVFPGTQGGPLEHIIAAKAVCFREASQANFRNYQRQVRRNAAQLADCLKKHGFRLVSDGTDNHLILVDLRQSALSGKDLELALGQANITVNKNTVPGETRSSFVTSGIRLGTPAVTSRGLGEGGMQFIANSVQDCLQHWQKPEKLAEIKRQVVEFARSFPLYPLWK